MLVAARVFWTIYYKDRTEIGKSDFLKNPEDLKHRLHLLMLWSRTRQCHVNIDVTFYPDCIFDKTITIMGAI